MQFLSVCSGIEAASVAWHPLGWRAHAFAEIDKFPAAVLAHHYPTVPNYGDITKFKDWPDATFDVLVGGTPCQSFSVAGLRKGLADPRGNLALVYLGILDRYRPRWMVWENVPGVLSSNEGRDFGAFLGGLAELGYGFAYRVLDAQYFGLAQRRKRVFVVGHLGDWRRAAAVLFEPESLQGNPPPRREAGKDAAPILSARTRGGGGLGTDFDLDGGLIASTGSVEHCLNAGGMGRIDYESETLVAFDETQITSADNRCNPQPGDPSHPLAKGARPPTIAFHARQDPDSGPVTHPLDTDGSSIGVLQFGDTYASPPQANSGALLYGVRQTLGEEAFAEWGLGILDTLQPAEILRSAMHGRKFRPAAFSRRWVVHCALSRKKDCSDGAMQSLCEAQRTGCAPQGRGPSQQLAGELGAYLSELSQPGAQAERFMRDLWIASEGIGLLREALSAVQEVRKPFCGEGEPIQASWRVRRLTVEECEFLQGFPRGYTAIPYRGKPAADGPRYKALGNSMAVPVMRWIGERIAAVDNMR